MSDQSPRNHAYHRTKAELEIGWRPRSDEDIKRFMLQFDHAKSWRGVLFCLREADIIDLATADRLCADPDLRVRDQYCTRFPRSWEAQIQRTARDFDDIPEWVPVVRQIGFSYSSR